MDEPDTRVDARLAALEKNDSNQDKQISELFGRVNDLEKQTSAQGAIVASMQKDIAEAKAAALAASNKLDALKTWMMGIAATTAATTLLALINLALRKL